VPAQPQGRTPASRNRVAGRSGNEADDDPEARGAAGQQGGISESAEEPGVGAAGDNGGENPGAAGEQTDDSDDPRRVAHELLGQAHAVLVIATRDAVMQYWCPEDLRGAFRDARGQLWIAVGDMQVVIGSGEHDAGLQEAGIGGPLARHKRKGLRKALERLVGVLARPTPNEKLIRAWLKSAAGLARTAIGSMVREVPGGEIIAEALDGVLSGIDISEALEIPGSTER
jgi:hypothetical protein